MNISSITFRLTLMVAAVALVMALAGTAQAATPRPAGMSKAEYRALLLRGEALNKKYGHDVNSTKPAGMTAAEYRALRLRGEALNKKYGHDVNSAKPSGMTAAEYRALVLRGQALNKKYGLGAQSTPSAVSAPQTSPRAFAWSAFGIGAAAMLGFVLLTAGVLLGSRAARHPSAVRTSS